MTNTITKHETSQSFLQRLRVAALFGFRFKYSDIKQLVVKTQNDIKEDEPFDQMYWEFQQGFNANNN